VGKRIIVCSDGTGNTAIKGRGTNVFKLFEAVDLNGHRFDANLVPQVAIYDDGVGTQHFKPVRIASGASGWGLSRNVKQLYKELARLYDPGDGISPPDEIYMFGFSRGAFTVRTLVGLIATCGLLDRDKLEALDLNTADRLEKTVDRAYTAYRKCYWPWLAQTLGAKPTKDPGQAFKEKYSHDQVAIKFLGVWDTVDAVGLPFHLSDILNLTVYRFKFPDSELSSIVERACHALAIDDQRQSFHPLMWHETEEDKAKGRIDQVWFAGAHSNVGGGYPKQGMSIVAMDWMLTEAERAGSSLGDAGLRIIADDRAFYRDHANVDDKLYDPRAGLGIFYRWRIRDIEKLCRTSGADLRIHLSVLERAAHGTEDYAPGNIPPDACVVITIPEDPEHAELAGQRALNVREVLCNAQQRLLSEVKFERIVGELSYYVYLLSCMGVLVVASGWSGGHTMRDLWFTTKAIGGLIGGFFASNPAKPLNDMVTQLVRSPQLLAWLGAGFAVAYFMDLYADSNMSRVFSEYWHRRQRELRKALKQARQGRDQHRRARQP